MTTLDLANSMRIGREFLHVTAAGTNVVKASPGVLWGLVLIPLANGTVDIYNNTAGSGTRLARIITVENDDVIVLRYEVWMDVGITTVMSVRNMDMTVVYS